MNTEIIRVTDPALFDEGIERAAQYIKRGGIAAMPTETVYGLAANALDSEAVAKIFKAKGRPQDNPLIVHIASLPEIYRLVKDFPLRAHKLADAFWPGPLTMILPKTDLVPDTTSGGLDTVAIRMPSDRAAHALIAACGVPLAAPSANISGRPSPTSFRYVSRDMDGRVECIIDGGDSAVGVESTVVTLVPPVPRLLRPGGITPEQLRSVLGRIDIDPAVLHPLGAGVKAISPGMKYKHYAPKAEVYIVRGSLEDYLTFLSHEETKDGDFCLCYEGEEDKVPSPV